MKNILIIGVGRFGRHLAEKFVDLGDDVMVVDRDEEVIQPLLSTVTYAQVGDCKKTSVLKSLGINNFDICFVCIGGDFQSSLEVTSLLKELGAKYVISKAGRDVHAKFLLRNGADEVVYPEKQMASKVAVKYSSNHLVDYFEISENSAIYEVKVPESWIGKSINALNVRSKYGLNILGIRKIDKKFNSTPGPNYIFEENDQMLVLSSQENIRKFIK